MTLEEYLSSASYMNDHIKILLNEKAKLYQIATAINCDMSKERVQTSASGDKLPNIIAKIIDLERQIDREIDAYIDRKRAIRGLIKSVLPVSEIQWRVLVYRYMMGLCWDDVADKCNYSVSQIKRIHKAAIEEIRRQNPKKVSEIEKMNRNELE